MLSIEFKRAAIFANRYRLVEFLGNGKFTEVWHAFDTLANVQLAVKFHIADNRREDILRKFAMVYDINHSNILHPIYIGIYDGVVYEVMQYCKLGNVAKLIENKNYICEKTCWKILHNVSSGLSCLHNRYTPILHLDIKPENILIQDENCFMITDFGISDYYSEDIEKSVNGTIAYMAPERFQEDNTPIKANDIWSLGAMMYEVMSNGQLPFGEMGGSIQSATEALHEIAADYSSDLKQIVYRCLSFYPWNRPVAKDIAMYSYKKIFSD